MTDNHEICICLDDVDHKGDEQHVLKLKCGHSYHTKCIADWIIAHGTCPYCRQHDGFDREEHNSGIRDCYSIETFNQLMQFIWILHLYEISISLSVSIFSYFTEVPNLKDTLLKWDGSFESTTVIHVLLTFILFCMVVKSCSSYALIGPVCEKYVKEIRTWSLLTLVMSLLRVSYPSLYPFICLAALIEDDRMFNRWCKSTHSITTSILFVQRIDDHYQ